MSVESSFFADRPANSKEAKDLPTELPSLTFPREYEDIYRVDSAMNVKQVGPSKFEGNLDRWYFRMN